MKYEVIAILGIEQSPSCCVNYIYTNFFISSKALVSWSGQEVPLSPQRIPFFKNKLNKLNFRRQIQCLEYNKAK